MAIIWGFGCLFPSKVSEWMSSTVLKASCHSPSLAATRSCSNLVSMYSASVSGCWRSGLSLWSWYLFRLARWFLMISHTRLNSVCLWYVRQKL